MTNESKNTRNYALITGASGGIGYELTKLLAQDHHNLVLVARSTDKLEELAQDMRIQYGCEVLVLPLDLSQSNSIQELMAAIRSSNIAIHTLVNNAGYGIYGQFAQQDMDNVIRMLQLNITTLTQLTRLLLPPMLERRSGRILNVASTGAFQPVPLMAAYAASKSYVLHFSEAIGQELRGTGVTVTALCPGPTTTGFSDRADMKTSRMVSPALFMSAQKVAEQGYKAMLQGKPVIVTGLTNKLQTGIIRLVPRRIVARASKILLSSSDK